MNNYIKTVKTTDEHIKELKNRWLNIINNKKNKKILESIWYYRMSQYFKAYQLVALTKKKKVIILESWLVKYQNRFHKDIYFKDILDLYKFDKNLRLLTYDIIETIEIDLKSNLINTLSHKTNTFAPYLDIDIFKSEVSYLRLKNDIEKILSENHFKNHEIWKHFNSKYKNESFPPIWMLLNNVNFWFLAKVYNSLHFEIRWEISNKYWYNYTDFSSIIEIIRLVRNKIAHHDRLFNTNYEYNSNNIKFLEVLSILWDFELIISWNNDVKTKINKLYIKNNLRCFKK